MKRIIDGKAYNTETATLLGEYSIGKYGDFQYVEENLYRTKKGQYFLAYQGGAMSKYAEQVDSHTTSGGEGITLLEEAEAKRWAEKNLDADTYTNIFGEVEEG